MLAHGSSPSCTQCPQALPQVLLPGSSRTRAQPSTQHPQDSRHCSQALPQVLLLGGSRQPRPRVQPSMQCPRLLPRERGALLSKQRPQALPQVLLLGGSWQPRPRAQPIKQCPQAWPRERGALHSRRCPEPQVLLLGTQARSG